MLRNCNNPQSPSESHYQALMQKTTETLRPRSLRLHEAPTPQVEAIFPTCAADEALKSCLRIRCSAVGGILRHDR